MCFQRIKKSGGKAKIAFHKLFLILWTIDTCEIENEISFCAVVVEFFLSVSEIILKNIIYLYIFIQASLTFLYVIKLGAKVSSHKTISPCYQYLHKSLIFSY